MVFDFLGFSTFGFVLFLLWTVGIAVCALFFAGANPRKTKIITEAVNKEIDEFEALIKKEEARKK